MKVENALKLRYGAPVMFPGLLHAKRELRCGCVRGGVIVEVSCADGHTRLIHSGWLEHKQPLTESQWKRFERHGQLIAFGCRSNPIPTLAANVRVSLAELNLRCLLYDFDAWLGAL